MPEAEKYHPIEEVYGISRDLPLNYVEREEVDDLLLKNLIRNKHPVIHGSSKQGKTCLRKNCLNDDEYIVIQCSNNWDLGQLHSTILKEAGYKVTLTDKKAISGKTKINLAPVSIQGQVTSETKEEPLEIDPEDVNDVIRALDKLELEKFIILEDFHYLPVDTQRDFAISLKAFHEKSKYTFIIVGVWLEDNRMIVYNGDLTERVVSVNADRWKEDRLIEVIEEGEKLLNVHFDERFKKKLVRKCFDSVHIVQETCRKSLDKEGIHKTQDEYKTDIGNDTDVNQLIEEVVDQQSARYESFLINFSDGFRDTRLEMYKWLLFPVLTSSPEKLQNGFDYPDIRDKIQSKHPEGEDLNPGNLTQALQYAASLQVKKEIRPIILDYDSTNKRLVVVDRGFIIWMANQSKKEMMQYASLHESVR